MALYLVIFCICGMSFSAICLYYTNKLAKTIAAEALVKAAAILAEAKVEAARVLAEAKEKESSTEGQE